MVTASGEYKRRNGFEAPFDKLQVLSWIICTYLVLSFFLVVVPLQDDTTKVWSSIVYALLLTVFCFLTLRTGGKDPVDQTTLMSLQQTPRDIPSSELLYCCFCKCKVHKRSKHCGLCNKCVSDFDHHCKWLNNCVGGSNYKNFFRLINVGFVFTAYHSAIALWVFLSVLAESGFPKSAPAGSYFVGVDRTGLLVALMSSCALAAFASTMLFHLIVFHLYLQNKKLSTYDYILIQRAKKAEVQNNPPPASRSRSKVEPEVTEARMDQVNGGGAAPASSSTTVSGETLGSGRGSGRQTPAPAPAAARRGSKGASITSGASNEGETALGAQGGTGGFAAKPVAKLISPLPLLEKVGTVTADGQIAELLPGVVNSPPGARDEIEIAQKSTRGKEKKGLLKPLPHLSAPMQPKGE